MQGLMGEEEEFSSCCECSRKLLESSRSLRTLRNMISTKKEMSLCDSKGNIYVLLKKHFQDSNVNKSHFQVL
jgi:hypothetical protein